MGLPVDDIPQQVTIPQLRFRRLEKCVKTQITFKKGAIERREILGFQIPPWHA
jgi:hypothetical protein